MVRLFFWVFFMLPCLYENNRDGNDARSAGALDCLRLIVGSLIVYLHGGENDSFLESFASLLGNERRMPAAA